MRKIILSLALTMGLALVGGSTVLAQPASESEALTVATNWIAAIIAKKGNWGGSETAEIEDIVEFSRQGHQVGYFCKVKPRGYIVVSLRKEMAPVKAYSATSELDPLSEEGMADLLKGGMERVLDRIQAREQKMQKGMDADLTDMFEIDYRPAWDALEGDAQDVRDFLSEQPAETEKAPLAPESDDEGEGAGETSNYQEGEIMLTSNWDQSPPYNNDCPDLGCSNSNGNAIVGCVATAGAQLMRYWNWPPYGEGSSTHGGETVSHSDYYDWVNMPDDATTSSPAAQQAAVAELSHEVGVAVSMDYGCGSSGAYTSDMEDVYEDHYRYSSTWNGTGADKEDRDDYNASTWFSMMKSEFNLNRPVQYRIPGHSIVGDGWQTVGTTNQYHMNYGWSSTSSDAWYTVDALQGGDPGEEYLIRRIVPATALTSLTGTYPKETFRYRYFYRDTSGGSGTFEGGQYLQFLPEVVVGCSSGTVRFENSTGNYSRLFTRGDLYRGIYMPYTAISAAVKMYPGGGIKFH